MIPLAVRTFKEINELIIEGKQNEITQEEWRTFNELVDATIKLMKPIIEFIDTLENQFGQFLDLIEIK